MHLSHSIKSVTILMATIGVMSASSALASGSGGGAGAGLSSGYVWSGFKSDET